MTPMLVTRVSYRVSISLPVPHLSFPRASQMSLITRWITYISASLCWGLMLCSDPSQQNDCTEETTRPCDWSSPK
uniref:Uncharacterized protein n=1 Tax=Setaria italica TaxID=4555 RepID=K3YEE8_SETIT